jgi:hypothetical protein
MKRGKLNTLASFVNNTFLNANEQVEVFVILNNLDEYASEVIYEFEK